VLGPERRDEEAHEAEGPSFIQAQVEIRETLRQEKQWAQADDIRDRLAALGVTLEDGPQGTEWRWRMARIGPSDAGADTKEKQTIMPKNPPEKIQDIDEMAHQIDEALAEARQTMENLAQTKET